MCMVILLIALGCAEEQRSDAQEVTDEQKEALLPVAEPIVDNILKGYNEANYEVWSKDFDEVMLETMTEEAFVETQALIFDTIGKFQTKEFDNVTLESGYYVVRYKGNFEKEEGVEIKVVLSETDDGMKVSGLWFNSPMLQEKMESYTVSEEEAENILAVANPIVDVILEGYNENDYEKYTQNFDETTLIHLPPEAFQEAQDFMHQTIGKYLSREVERVIEDDVNIVVLYQGIFEKDENVTIRVVFAQGEEGYKVTGLIFDSPALREAAAALQE